MREICSSGSVGERGGNEPLYPEIFHSKITQRRMNKFYVRATDGAVPSVKFELLNYQKIKIYTDEKNNNINCCLWYFFELPKN